MERIYLDHAATTPLDPRVLEEMLPALRDDWGNASSIHAEGRKARRAIDRARRQVAEAIGCAAQEVYFTSGGSESDNWALKGIMRARAERGKHLIISAIEHHAILHAADSLEREGFEVTRLPVDAEGRVSPEDVTRAIRPDTVLVSVMTANNEIGTLQPIRAIADIAHAHGALMHTDAVQAVGAVPVLVDDLGVDLLSMSAHKFHGPKGVGALYVRRGTRIEPLVDGGAQERGLRAGTENVAGIVGLGCAITLATRELTENAARETALRERLMEGILNGIPGTRINGSRTDRLPNNCNVTFEGLEGEALLLRLDLAGISASSGSACTSGSLDPSHVLLAIGLTPEQTSGSLRMTLGRGTTEAQIDEVLTILPGIVRSLRDMTQRQVFTAPPRPVV